MKTSSARCITLLPFTLFLFCGTSRGEDSIMCGDGKHIKIDVAQFSNKYKGSSFVVTLGALNAMSGSLKVEPIQLQQASELVQLWDEFVKSLAIGYNSCAISKEQYAEGITHLYPRLSEDASKLELIRNRIIDNKTPDTETTNGLINDFYQNLKLFADVSGERKKLDYLLSHSRKQDEEISQDTKKIKNLQDQIDELKASFQRTPLQTPTEVKSEIRTKLLDKAQIAENAYNVGYMLLGNGDPTQAIVHFKEAIENVALPAFYLALGRAYVESSDLNKAEEVLRNGLALKGSDNLDTVKLKNDLSHILLAAGDPRDLKEAEKLAFDALTISEAHDGSNSDRVAALSANLGVVYRKQGNLEKAYLYAKRAFDIDEHDKSSKISTNPNAALDANNLAVVLQNTGNFDEAEQYARYSISSYTEIYGSESPELAVPLETLSRILDDKGQHDVALQEIERAIWLAQRTYRPDSLTLAYLYLTIGIVLEHKELSAPAKPDRALLVRSLTYDFEALEIQKQVMGYCNADVAKTQTNISKVYLAMKDWERALIYRQRAQEINIYIFGVASPQVILDNVYIVNINRLINRDLTKSKFANQTLLQQRSFFR